MFAEKLKLIPLMNSADISTGADLDSINMKNFHRVTFLITCGAVTTDLTATPTSGASAGTKTTAVPAKYAAGGAVIGTAVAGSAASCDVLAAWTSHASAYTLSAASNKFLVIEIEAADMTDGEPWLTVRLTTATGGIVHAVAVLQPRYTGNRSATALA
jgi:hypothetical protein